MSLSKRYLESLPEEEQNEILGVPPEDDGEDFSAEFDRWMPDFNENDCGGVFDGFGVVSDADPGL